MSYPTPSRDTHQFTLSSIIVSINEKIFPQHFGIEYDVSANGGEPAGSGKIYVPMHKREDLLEIIAPDRGPYMATNFMLTVQCAEPDMQSTTDTFSQCKIFRERYDYVTIDEKRMLVAEFHFSVGGTILINGRMGFAPRTGVRLNRPAGNDILGRPRRR